VIQGESSDGQRSRQGNSGDLFERMVDGAAGAPTDEGVPEYKSENDRYGMLLDQQSHA
jgi:hypothetical protein